MPPESSTYHQRVAQEKRAVITAAATELFLASGYDSTSLAKIAHAAGVSKATLFKQFPTKAALFDAIVAEAWNNTQPGTPDVSVDDFSIGLATIGRRYADLLNRPEMAALFRIVIAELPRFPELGLTHFHRGKMPYFDSVRKYLDDKKAAGGTDLDDTEIATTQFLGMISNFVLWPRMLLADWSPDAAQIQHVVDEAVLMMAARYTAATENTQRPY